jgi:hypothetical protein
METAVLFAGVTQETKMDLVLSGGFGEIHDIRNGIRALRRRLIDRKHKFGAFGIV